MTYWSAPRVYRKRPVAVEAMQWTGGRENAQLIMNWAHNHGVKIAWVPWVPGSYLDDGTVIYNETPEHLEIPTLEGTMIAYFGDYVIKGVQGEFYPRKAAIFDATYVAADADNGAMIRRAAEVIRMSPRIMPEAAARAAKRLADANLLAPPDTEPASLARPAPQRLTGAAYREILDQDDVERDEWNAVGRTDDGATVYVGEQGKAFPAFRDRVLEDPEARAAYERAREEFKALEQKVTEAEAEADEQEPLHTGMQTLRDGTVRHTLRDAAGRTVRELSPCTRCGGPAEQGQELCGPCTQTEAIDQEDVY